MYILDIIKDEFKKWGPGPVIIDAGTGCGKTYFILHILNDWVNSQWPNGIGGHKILYLCNRSALLGDVARRLDGDDDYELEFHCITIKTYQWLENYLKNNKEGLKRRLGSYRYIVSDEYHYYTSDSVFNKNTDQSYLFIRELWDEKTIIYMSATGNVLLDEWRQHNEISWDKYYRLDKDYSYIESVTLYYTDQERQDILDGMPEGEKVLVFMNRINDLVKTASKYGNTASYYCSKNNDTGGIDSLEECIVDGKMKKSRLFATTALYNGIDLKDENITCILVEPWTPIEIIQAIGRKRPVGPGDKCKIYLRAMSRQQIAARLKYIQMWLAPGEAWKNRGKTDGKSWEDFLEVKDAAKMIDAKKTLEYDTISHEGNVYEMAILELKYEKKILEKMERLGYQQAIQEELFDQMGIKHHEVYVYRAVRQYLADNVGKKLRPEEVKRNITILGNLKSKENGLAERKEVIRMIEDAHYSVKVVRNWKRNRDDYGITMWMIQGPKQ